MNTPHTHPRATEFLYLVNGHMEAGFIEENGARFVVNQLTAGQGTLFPAGSIHYQFNTGCEPIKFVAALNNEDPGASQVAQRCEYPGLVSRTIGVDINLFLLVFGLNLEVVDATLGDIGLKEVNDIAKGVSPTCNIFTSSLVMTSDLSRSRTALPLVSTRVSRGAASRGASSR